jgi:deoxyxylulose-5-phosphate synthase
LGLGDKLIDHANHNEQLSLAGLDSEQIIGRIQQRLDRL